jgi:hypothetical protein
MQKSNILQASRDRKSGDTQYKVARQCGIRPMKFRNRKMEKSLDRTQ